MRVLPILAGIVVAVLAIEYAWVKNDEAQEQSVSRIRTPSPNLAKLPSVQGAKNVVFATQTAGGNLIAAVPSPTANG